MTRKEFAKKLTEWIDAMPESERARLLDGQFAPDEDLGVVEPKAEDEFREEKEAYFTETIRLMYELDADNPIRWPWEKRKHSPNELLKVGRKDAKP